MFDMGPIKAYYRMKFTSNQDVYSHFRRRELRSTITSANSATNWLRSGELQANTLYSAYRNGVKLDGIYVHINVNSQIDHAHECWRVLRIDTMSFVHCDPLRILHFLPTKDKPTLENE
jgi:hypothetical protein